MKLGLVNILLEYILFILSNIFTPTTEELFSQLVSWLQSSIIAPLVSQTVNYSVM